MIGLTFSLGRDTQDVDRWLYYDTSSSSIVLIKDEKVRGFQAASRPLAHRNHLGKSDINLMV